MKSIFTAQLESLSTRQDKTLKIVLGTSEITPEAKSRLFDLHQKSITVLLSDSGTSEEEIKAIEEAKIEVKPKEGKSLSQIQRNVLFRIWETQKGGRTFDQFYDYEMNRHIEQLKERIER